MIDSQVLSHVLGGWSIFCRGDVEWIITRQHLKQVYNLRKELSFIDAFFLVVGTVYLHSFRDLVFGKAGRKTTFEGRSHKTTNRFGIRTRHPQFLKSMSKGIVNPDRTVNEGSIQVEKDS